MGSERMATGSVNKSQFLASEEDKASSHMLWLNSEEEKPKTFAESGLLVLSLTLPDRDTLAPGTSVSKSYLLVLTNNSQTLLTLGVFDINTG